MNIEISDDFKDPKDCMVIIVIQGSDVDIDQELERILIQHRINKPKQGMKVRASSITQVITPVWDGKKY